MKSHRYIWIATLLTLVAGSALAQSPSDNRQGPCSNIALKGAYGYYGSGTTLPNEFGVPPGPFISLGVAKFDGFGRFTWTSSDFPGSTLGGAYNVLPDCTGTVSFEFPAPFPPAPGEMVVVSGGKELFIAPPKGPDMVTVAVFVYKRQ
jgi:hypothetical protein